MRRTSIVVATLVLIAAYLAVPVGTAGATGADPAPAPGTPAEPDPQLRPDRVPEPDRMLGAGWRRSADRAVTTAGDATGLHVLAADRRDAYQWRTVATLAEPVIESDQWIGQACVTGSGNYAIVVYAPRTFTNYLTLLERGAFAAVVDLRSGEVTKLPQRVTLAYYNPSCGAGETAVLSRLEQSPAAGVPAKSWIATVDAPAATVGPAVRADGQVTSAVPVDGRILAAKGHSLVEVGDQGETTVVAQLAGAPLRLLPDGQRGLAFQVARGDQVDLARLINGRVRTAGTVPAGAVKLRPGAGGEVYAIGGRATERVGGLLPPHWRLVDALPDSEPSTGGGLVVTRARTMREAAGLPVGAAGAGPGGSVQITALLDRGDELEFTAHVAAGAAGRRLTPAWGGPAGPDPGGSGGPAGGPAPQNFSDVPWDPDRACAVPRNDPTVQVYQPSPRQVEWAANLAVRGQLNFVRPANWLNNGLPSYIPQGSFPSLPLAGGGHVPAQVYLGILAQESNLWQASWHVVDALAGNPLTSSGFYGLDYENPDPTKIDWTTHDCGYGAGQVTTGMHSDDTGEVVNGVLMTETRQQAVVTDYATNVAAGLRILQAKWNQTFQAGIIANGGDPQYIENWFLAAWAYNSGVQPDERFGNDTGCTPSPTCTDEHGNWGLGWSNNPASPLYPEDRQMFLTAPLDVPSEGIDDEIGYDNAKHPNHWSYPERVMGFAYTSLIRWDYASQSWQDTYLSAGDPLLFRDAQPDRLTFCVAAANQCDPNATPKPPGEFPNYPDTLCQRDDLRCWWHDPVTWEPDCDIRCGIEVRRFTTVEPRPLASAIYDSQCSTTGLPTGARVIDDIDSASPLGPQGCARNWTVGGDFSLEFETITGVNGDPVHPGKVDFHQIGGGFGGHFWFAHSHANPNTPMKVTGTWTPANRFDGWVRVMAHLPDHGAHTQQARYEIHTGDGTRERFLPTRRQEHAWVSLGAYQFDDSGAQRVELTNLTEDGRGVEDVAWDAVAFVPLPGKPQDFVVAMGDSYISGEGAGNYYGETDTNYGDHGWNACRRSRNAWPRKLVLPGTGSSLGQRADSHSATVDFQFVACSGATASDMSDTTAPGYWQNPPGSYSSFTSQADGQFGEISQLKSGVLSSDTTLVLLSAGGNDAGFPTVLEDCAAGNCASSSQEQAIQDDINDAVGEVADLVDAIRVEAPNATIVLAGYPMLFSERIYNDPLHPGFCVAPGVYTMNEAMMLNSLAHYFRDVHKGMIMSRGDGYQFVDLVSRFGDHGTCHNSEEIHAVVEGPTGDGDFRFIGGTPQCFGWTLLNFCVSRASFHPKDSGTTRYGNAVADRLACAEFCVGSTGPGGDRGRPVTFS